MRTHINDKSFTWFCSKSGEAKAALATAVPKPLVPRRDNPTFELFIFFLNTDRNVPIHVAIPEIFLSHAPFDFGLMP